MGDLTTLHTNAKRLVLALRDGLERLEAAEQHSSQLADAGALYLDLRKKLQDLQVISSDMESVWRMFVLRETAAKRALWKGKVEQVVEEVGAIRRTLDKFGGREQRRAAEQRERQELLGGARAGLRGRGELDEEAQMAGSFARSKRALEDIYETGSSILTNMAGNRERLKRVQRRALDVLHSIGLGETILKLIERRQRIDIWTTYGGMAVVTLVVLVVMWLCWVR